MRITQPRPAMKRQELTSTPTVGDSTLVDDTVALVDSTTALVGGQTTIWSGIKVTIKRVVPSSSIKIRR